jgi:transcriptional regulator GlxA family with amidase domain
MMKARRTEAADRASSDSKLDEVKRFIRGNLSDPELSVEAVAQANYLSVRSVHKLFAEIGETPAAWVREQRLREAKRILSDPACGLSITEIAQRCGFSSIAQFSHIFRQTTGLTPTAYRESQRAG